MKNLIRKCWLWVIIILIAACSKPADPNFNNLYDERSSSFIPHPGVNTLEVINISALSAVSGGAFGSNYGYPITEKGVCWSMSQNPTIRDLCTTQGGGVGSFVSELNSLRPNTKYYVRAYATNRSSTEYGNQREFRTQDTNTAVVDVRNPSTGRTWMDRNLGASRTANSSTDIQAYGDLYQWGRAADGHQSRNSGTTSTLSGSNQPGHGSFILAPNSPWDWRSPQINNFWQGVNGTNNPCPSGYRLPTDVEWEAERRSWTSNNTAGAFASPLRLPMAGYRFYSNGSLGGVSSNGCYWSGTAGGAYARGLCFHSSTAYMFNDVRAYGVSVRCLKN